MLIVYNVLYMRLFFAMIALKILMEMKTMSVANQKVKLMNEVCDDYFCNMAKFFPVIQYRDDITGFCVCDLCCHEYPCNQCVFGGEE